MLGGLCGLSHCGRVYLWPVCFFFVLGLGVQVVAADDSKDDSLLSRWLGAMRFWVALSVGKSCSGSCAV